LAPDDAGQHLMVIQLVMTMTNSPHVGSHSNVLLHYDYERNKAGDYPEAHLQVCASSKA
jgi:hypothetical protein